jgi:hypothetical protein
MEGRFDGGISGQGLSGLHEKANAVFVTFALRTTIVRAFGPENLTLRARILRRKGKDSHEWTGCPFPLSIQKFPRIQDAVGIERILERAVGGEGDFAEGLTDPRLFGEADAVLTGDGTVVGEHPGE